LETLIESVLSQEYPSLEHVVIDDGSDDDGSTVGILRRYEQLRWWSESWRGQYAAMNLGLRRAKGSIVCFISGDDLCAPGAVESAVEYLAGHSQADCVYGKAVYIDQSGQAYPVQIPLYRAPLRSMPDYYFIPHCALFFRRAVLEREGLWFDESLRYWGDYDWMMRISRAKLRIGYTPRVVAQVRVHPEQASHTRSRSIEAREVWSTGVMARAEVLKK
jgi:glycosyltransferase involved in cell wall biosynthesis